MKKVITTLFCLCLLLGTYAQDSSERIAVVQTLEKMFDAMRAGDSATLATVFHPEARMMSTFYDPAGAPQLRMGSVKAFLTAVGTPHDQVWDEKIWSYDIQVDQTLATAWTPYAFFAGENFSHCGVNAFQLTKTAAGWKIMQVMDTRQREGCQTEATDTQKELETLIANWHRAAAEADEDTYFGSMSEESIFIGTDASERWTKEEFMDYAAEAFTGDSAWDFKSNYRYITISEDGRQAWWDEQLDTWMGTCMATGVLTKTEDGWKIGHYQLSLAVPNEKIEAFQELIKKK